MAREARYWLFKTEPESFSIDDLAAEPKRTTCWSGVRNYQARNLLRDGVQRGDGVLFYHSSADPAAVVGTARVVRTAYGDPTALDPKDSHFDPKATRDDPRWVAVDIKLEKKFRRPLPLPELRDVKALQGMELLKRGSRLSIQPVTRKQFQTILKLAGT